MMPVNIVAPTTGAMPLGLMVGMCICIGFDTTIVRDGAGIDPAAVGFDASSMRLCNPGIDPVAVGLDARDML